MRIIGLIVLIVTTLVVIGSNLAKFADVPSLIMVLGFPVAVVLMARVSSGAMFRDALSSQAGPEDVAEAIRGWELARRAAVAGGYLGTLIGAVIILMYIEPETPPGQYLKGSAVGILTLVYGLFVGYGLCLPCEIFARSRQEG